MALHCSQFISEYFGSQVGEEEELQGLLGRLEKKQGTKTSVYKQ
jgi:hypothetical protein